MWKFHNFSSTQILREIKISECRVSKSAILSHLEAQNFDFSWIPALFGGWNFPK